MLVALHQPSVSRAAAECTECGTRKGHRWRKHVSHASKYQVSLVKAIAIAALAIYVESKAPTHATTIQAISILASIHGNDGGSLNVAVVAWRACRVRPFDPRLGQLLLLRWRCRRDFGNRMCSGMRPGMSADRALLSLHAACDPVRRDAIAKQAWIPPVTSLECVPSAHAHGVTRTGLSKRSKRCNILGVRNFPNAEWRHRHRNARLSGSIMSGAWGVCSMLSWVTAVLYKNKVGEAGTTWYHIEWSTKHSSHCRQSAHSSTCIG